MASSCIDNVVVKRFDWESQTFLDPFLSDGVIKNFDMPIRLVGQLIHDNHHGNFPDKKHLRIGAMTIMVDADRVNLSVMSSIA